jgi:hypothetical protein
MLLATPSAADAKEVTRGCPCTPVVRVGLEVAWVTSLEAGRWRRRRVREQEGWTPLLELVQMLAQGRAQ